MRRSSRLYGGCSQMKRCVPSSFAMKYASVSCHARERAAADVAHLAGADQVVERAQGLVDRDVGLGAVDLVEVDPVGLEAAQRRFALLDDVAARVALHVRVFGVHHAVDLRGQDDVVAAAVALERLAGHLFAAADAVDIGGIDEVDALIERLVDDGVRVVGRGLAAEHHAAEAEAADLDAGAAEGSEFHMVRSFLSCRRAGHLTTGRRYAQRAYRALNAGRARPVTSRRLGASPAP